jgi:hypothetical protein
MKKILGVIFLSLLLSGCGDFYKGNKYLAQAGVSQNAGQHGWSNISLKDAENNAMAACEVFKNRKLGFGLDKNKTCRVIGSYINPNHPGTQNEIAVIKQKKAQEIAVQKKLAKERELENEYGRYIQQCEYIGFKKNTDKMGECVLKMYNTEIKLAQLNAQQRTADSSDVLTNMFLLNESLKLLNPPQPKRFNCIASTVGTFMNVNCN